MKKLTLTFALFIACSLATVAQTKPTAAVANPNVTGLFATPEIAAKLIRLELIKIDKYMVYDEFDMNAAYAKNEAFGKNCLNKTCLQELGQELNVDYVVSGSFDLLGNKIVVSLKFIDVKNNTICKTGVREFDNQEVELQRMTEIVLKEMHDIEVSKELIDALQFNNEVITSNNVGKISNSGPRIGVGFMTGSMADFAMREDRGGLNIKPVVSMIGYQVEKQYVGTDKFGALVEVIFNVSGLEQLKFIPTITVMNGFRFGKQNWEIAFGPGFGVGKMSQGFFDTDGLFGKQDTYFSNSDWNEFTTEQMADPSMNPEFFKADGSMKTLKEINEKYETANDVYHGDTRGDIRLYTNFLIAAGRTFKAGALNVPVNVFYSARRGGGLVGLSVGFNITKSKTAINAPKN